MSPCTSRSQYPGGNRSAKLGCRETAINQGDAQARALLVIAASKPLASSHLTLTLPFISTSTLEGRSVSLLYRVYLQN